MRNCSRNSSGRVGRLGWVAATVVVVISLPSAGCSKPRIAAPPVDRRAASELREKLVVASVGGGATEAAAATGTGWGSLKGRFLFVGAPPAPKPLVVDKDTEVCTKAGVKLLDRSLLVDASSKGLADVVVFARKTSRVK